MAFYKLAFTWVLIIQSIKFSHSTDSSDDNDTTKCVALDVRLNKSGENFYIFKSSDSKSYLFMPKSGYLFNSVNQSKYSLNVFGKDLDIWTAENDNKYASLVMLEGKGSSSKRVHIQLVDGTTRSFYKLKKPHYWSTQQWFSGLLPLFEKLFRLSNHEPENIKITTKGNNSETKENDLSSYDILVKKKESGFRSSNGKMYHEGYFYIPKDQFRFSTLKFKDDTVSNFTEKYPQSIAYFPNSDKIKILYNYSFISVYTLKDGKWEMNEDSENTELEINSKKDCEQGSYRFYKDDSTNTCVYLSTGSKFSKVKHDDNVVFESSDSDEHAYLVVVNGCGTNEQNVTAYLENGTKKSVKL